MPDSRPTRTTRCEATTLLRRGLVALIAWAGCAAEQSARHEDAGVHVAAEGGGHAADQAGRGGDGSAAAGQHSAAADSGGAAIATAAGSGSAGHAAAGSSAGRAGSSAGRAGSATAGAAAPGKPPFKGVANSPCAARTALQVSWYYNWTQRENEPCSDGSGGEFVPMIWGHTGDEQSASGIASAVTALAQQGYGNVLGFNEPDNAKQANMPVDKAIALWPSFDQQPMLRVGSPSTQSSADPGQAWFKDFMARLADNSALRTDFLALHWYGWNAGSCDAKAAQLEGYVRWAEGLPGNRPIWLSEWGCLNASAADDATVLAFFQAAVAMLAKHPRVERYAWYPWATHCGLTNDDGSLTELGRSFAAAPMYKP
jgi:hypothetical protein